MACKRPLTRRDRLLRGVLASALPLVLMAACGGGSDGGSAETAAPPASCSDADQKRWLGDYMNEWYFWQRLSPRPDPAASLNVESYFNALLYTGNDPAFPADRWSSGQSTENFNRFFGDGSTLGYGVAVAGLELARDATRPLFVRHVEARSPAAAAGVQRGDRVVAINGRNAAELIAADDFAALTTTQVGQTLTLQLRRAGVDRTVVVTSAVFALTPVASSTVVLTAQGRKLGVLAVKDMISQATAPLEAAFAQFKVAAVDDVVLDLRYNGGGLVSVGALLASYVAGGRGNGLNYATLLYNDRRAATDNRSYVFAPLASSLGLPRVFVLMGRRTCSASEQVINGLRGAGVEVLTIGETSCGKPVGFLPVSACGRTYSVVNFESVNQRNEGRYFSGFDATCTASENHEAPLGTLAEPLLGSAAHYADVGSCLPVPRVAAAAFSASRGRGPSGSEPNEQQNMIGR